MAAIATTIQYPLFVRSGISFPGYGPVSIPPQTSSIIRPDFQIIQHPFSRLAHFIPRGSNGHSPAKTFKRELDKVNSDQDRRLRLLNIGRMVYERFIIESMQFPDKTLDSLGFANREEFCVDAALRLSALLLFNTSSGMAKIYSRLGVGLLNTLVVSFLEDIIPDGYDNIAFAAANGMLVVTKKITGENRFFIHDPRGRISPDAHGLSVFITDKNGDNFIIHDQKLHTAYKGAGNLVYYSYLNEDGEEILKELRTHTDVDGTLLLADHYADTLTPGPLFGKNDELAGFIMGNCLFVPVGEDEELVFMRGHRSGDRDAVIAVKKGRWKIMLGCTWNESDAFPQGKTRVVYSKDKPIAVVGNGEAYMIDNRLSDGNIHYARSLYRGLEPAMAENWALFEIIGGKARRMADHEVRARLEEHLNSLASDPTETANERPAEIEYKFFGLGKKVFETDVDGTGNKKDIYERPGCIILRSKKGTSHRILIKTLGTKDSDEDLLESASYFYPGSKNIVEFLNGLPFSAIERISEIVIMPEPKGDIAAGHNSIAKRVRLYPMEKWRIPERNKWMESLAGHFIHETGHAVDRGLKAGYRALIEAMIMDGTSLDTVIAKHRGMRNRYHTTRLAEKIAEFFVVCIQHEEDAQKAAPNTFRLIKRFLNMRVEE